MIAKAYNLLTVVYFRVPARASVTLLHPISLHVSSQRRQSGLLSHPARGRHPLGKEVRLERSAELARHDVVEDRVDGAVEEDHETREQAEPAVVEAVRFLHQRVVHDLDAVWEPEDGEHEYDHHQHLDDLKTQR